MYRMFSLFRWAQNLVTMSLPGSHHMDWYEGTTLMFHLENVHISGDLNHIDCRFPVQYVVRPQQDEHHDYRGYAGKIAGVFRQGDKVMVLPSGFTSRISKIDSFDGEIMEGFASGCLSPCCLKMRSISVVEIWLCGENNSPQVGQDIDLMICWLNDKKMEQVMVMCCGIQRVKYGVWWKMSATKLTSILCEELKTMRFLEWMISGRIQLRTTSPLFFDSYRRNRNTGSVILVDESTNETVGGMILWE